MRRKRDKEDQSNNFLYFVPCQNPTIEARADDHNHVVLTVVHKGFVNWVAQKLFFQHEKSYLHMDDLGSFVWDQIDGEQNIAQIAQNVKREFGEKAEPLYERLVPFLRTLQYNGFIAIGHPDEPETDNRRTKKKS